MRMPGLFVVGTDTGVGKTRVAAAIVRCLIAEGRRVGVIKPVTTGATRVGDCWRCDDAAELIAATGAEVPPERVTPLLYEEPVAPPIAARRSGRLLNHADVERAVAAAMEWWSSSGAEVFVVEGVGGLLCPLAEGTTVADLAVSLDFPLVVVGRRALGTLNHTLMTLESASIRSLRVAGVVLNSPEREAGDLAEATSAEELVRRLGDVPLLAELPYAPGDPHALTEAMAGVGWGERARAPRYCRLGA